MDYKDYYAALGVAPNADDQAIRDAYRKLARQHHPDVNPGDTQAEERFKEINEAYQALNDPQRRRQYDQMREQYQRWQQRGGPPPGYTDFNWGQTGAGAGTPRGYPGGQTYTTSEGTYVSPEDLEDLFGGDSPFSDFFSSMYGRGEGGTAGRGREPRPRRGRDAEVEVEITLEEAFHGATRSIQIGDRRIEARIPRGVRTGSRVRLAGQGTPGAAGGPAGDLYLNVVVLPHPVFEHDGDDLRADLRVDFYTAALGGEVRVPTIDGSVNLKIPPHTQADRAFRIRGKGMPRLERPADRGDMYARIKIVLPEPLSDAELEGLRELARTYHNK